MSVMAIWMTKTAAVAALCCGLTAQATAPATVDAAAAVPQRIDLDQDQGIIQYLIEIDDSNPNDIYLQWC